MWKKSRVPESLEIHGRSSVLIRTMFGTFTVLCITLPISRTNDSTLDYESIFGKNESLDLKIQLSSRRRVTSENDNYTGEKLLWILSRSLNRMLKNTEKNPLEELY